MIPAMPPCSSRTINGSFSIAAVSLGKVSTGSSTEKPGLAHHRHQKKGRRDSCCARHGLVPHPATGLAVPDPPRNRRYRWGVTPNPEGFPEILRGVRLRAAGAPLISPNSTTPGKAQPFEPFSQRVYPTIRELLPVNRGIRQTRLAAPVVCLSESVSQVRGFYNVDLSTVAS